MNGEPAVLETPTGHAAAAGDLELQLAVQQLREACAGSPAVAASVVAAAPLEPRLAELLQLPPSSGLVSAAAFRRWSGAFLLEIRAL